MDLRALALAWIDAFNRRDWDAYGAFFTDDVTYLTPGKTTPLVGREAHVAQDRANAGDARLEPTQIVVGDDGAHVVIEGRFVASDRVSQWVTVLTIRDGKIAAERLYFDRLRR
ncbi:MAG: nuclear transport factor 2 family protein [Dehalococcoidia bacterium]|nr:nuclear transport factor 2 family protein [Dehalococcoidia bacterium]